MVHPASWFWLTLGTTVVLAVACSSSDPKKTPNGVMPDIGGDAAGGAAPSGGGSVVNEGGADATPGASGTPGTDTGGQAAGGDASSEMTDSWLSGSRLRAVLQVADGTKLFTGWHDTELDVDCAWQFDPEGTERCVPRNVNGYLSYSDAKCTKLVAVVASTLPVPAWLPESNRLECSKGPAYRTVGATVAVTDKYTLDDTGACIAAGSIGADQIAKAVGAIVPATTFVPVAKRVREIRDARLSATVRVAADGSREVTSLFDRERRADCRPREHAGDDGLACVPINRAYLQPLFADASCGARAASYVAHAQGCGKPPDIVLDLKELFTDDYFEVGKDVTGAVYSMQPACKPYVSIFGPDTTFFAVGKPIAWASLAQLSTGNEGAGRIALRVTRGADHELLSREAFFDTKLGTVCRESVTSDLKTRCAPSTIFQTAFADDKCTQGLLANAAGVAPVVQADFAQAPAAGGGTTFFKRGAKVATPTTIWNASSFGCAGSPPPPGLDYYATTTIAPTEMVLLTTETE